MSVRPDGNAGGGADFSPPTISADGRYVGFFSSSSDFVEGDNNGRQDLFVRDMVANTTEIVSLGAAGQQTGDSFYNFNSRQSHSMSADGRFVAFVSHDSALVPNDTNSREDIFVRDRLLGTTEIVSRGSTGTQTGDHTYFPALSADGRFVTFISHDSALVPDDTNSREDIFVRDRLNNTTELVSTGDAGQSGDLIEDAPDISDDGRYVAFLSHSSTIVSGDGNSREDIFLRDRQAGTTEIVSRGYTGAQVGDVTRRPVLSGDGRKLVFYSADSALVPDDGNASPDVFLRDLDTNTVERVSAGIGVHANGGSNLPAISSDGRFVSFTSGATNLAGTDGNAVADVFLRDRTTMLTSRASVSSGGGEANQYSQYSSLTANADCIVFDSLASNLTPVSDTNGVLDVFVRERLGGTGFISKIGSTVGNGASSTPAASAGGNWIAFESLATNFVSGANSTSDIFVRHRTSDVMLRASTALDGASDGNGPSHNAAINADGRYVAFQSSATNLVSGDFNGRSDVFVRDMVAGVTQRISIGALGEASGDSGGPAITGDGRFVAFSSDAPNLVGGDVNGVSDIFLWDRSTGGLERVSLTTLEGEANAACHYPRISSDGRFITFQSTASNLVLGDGNGVMDVFVRDRLFGVTLCLSVSETGVQGNAASLWGALSADGAWVAFASAASNLVSHDANGEQDIFVTPVPATNREPVADAGPDQIVTVPHDGNPGTNTVTVTLDGSSSFDPEGQPLTYHWEDRSTFRTAGSSATISLSLTPGTYNYALLVRDECGYVDEDLVTITVQPEPNQPPVGQPDSYTAIANQTLTVAAPGVLGNDTDADGDSLSAQVSDDPQHGKLALSGAGGFTYTPDPDYTGPDSFTYRAFDGYTSSTPVTVSLTVAAPPPVVFAIQAWVTGPTSATILWYTERSANGTVEYGRTSALGSSAAGMAGTKNHDVRLTGLTPGALYYFRVRSTTTGGVAPASESVSDLYTFRTPPLVSGAMSLGYSLARDPSGEIRVHVTIFNNTGTTQQSVRITRGVLRASTTANPSNPLPLNLGGIPAGSSNSTTVLFPGSVGASGASGILSVGWSSSTHSSTSSFRVALP